MLKTDGEENDRILRIYFWLIWPCELLSDMTKCAFCASLAKRRMPSISSSVKYENRFPVLKDGNPSKILDIR